MKREIEAIVLQLKGIWASRNQMVEDALASLGQFYRRRKCIFYDTDRINETQEETVRICDKCQGYLTIASSAQRGYGILNSAFCISLPRNACSSCREDAKEEFEEHKEDRKFNYVYLQDKQMDTYHSYNTRTRNQKDF